jgi:clumping factor A
MIVASLLLILVAVTLLVVGLAGGSSALLISSIAASLLAAIALVAGARQAAGVRRAAMARTVPSADTVPGEDEVAPVQPVGSRPGVSRPADPAAYADDPPAADEGLASPGAAQARAARREDAESALAGDAAYRAEAAAADHVPAGSAATLSPSDVYDYDGEVPEGGYRDDYAVPPGYDDAGRMPLGDLDQDAGRTPADDFGDDRLAPPAPDYDRASSFIGGARSKNPDENAWRRGRGPDEAGPAREFDRAHEPGPADEFAEPDADDPADEPLPQAIRPADAVRIARMDAEVLVVDGRPRYHLADCAHLVGKLTEPLPVAEAVELGFSPCGLCRPVDRLVAQAARH